MISMEKIYTDFINASRASGHSEKYLFQSLLDDVINDVAEDWGVNVYALPFDGKVGNERIIAMLDCAPSTQYLLALNGSIYTYSSETKATGAVTWNGDDQFYNEYETIYTLKNKVDEVSTEFAKNVFNKSGVFDLEKLENLACQVCQAVQDLNDI